MTRDTGSYGDIGTSSALDGDSLCRAADELQGHRTVAPEDLRPCPRAASGTSLLRKDSPIIEEHT
jgi:hypothetical protein